METRPALKIADTPQSALPTKCPMTAALNAIGGKWSLICLYWLDSGTRRFNELRRLMPDIFHKVLASTLQGLEHEGLISRTAFAHCPPRPCQGPSSGGISHLRSRRICAPSHPGRSRLGSRAS